jgi:hypothetical protein
MARDEVTALVRVKRDCCNTSPVLSKFCHVGRVSTSQRAMDAFANASTLVDDHSS